MPKHSHKQLQRAEVIVSLLLILMTFVVFWPTLNHEFVHFDDDRYVTENRHVQRGITKEGIMWAFTATHASNWHPVTWLSHMLDCQIYGLDAGGHHLTSLLLHVMNTLLLFSVLKRMTRALWRSAFVAALFALHPLHVESVAWVSERKDVLSTFFWMLTMWGYTWYVERPEIDRYLLVLVLFVLGLMAKPMLVTLPFVFLLLDYWPLSRLQLGESGGVIGDLHQSSRALRLLREKIPFFIIAGASSIVTFFAQQSGGAIGSWERYPLSVRIANALVSYVSYIGKIVWPHHLAVYYPHPRTIPIWQAAGAGLFLICVCAVVIRQLRRRPYLGVGWFWYLGTLMPVSGLVQVGSHAMADRYTYVPGIGLFIIISWGVLELVTRWRCRKVVVTASIVGILVALSICSRLHVCHWRNSEALFKHCLDVTENNYLIHDNLGGILLQRGRLDEAIDHFSEAHRINPHFAAPFNNMGVALARQGRLDEAIRHYSKALQIDPDYADAHGNLGTALRQQGRLEEAISHYSKALEIDPGLVSVHNNLGIALSDEGRLAEAISHFSKALQINPDSAEAHNSLGVALWRQGNIRDAIDCFSRALQVDPAHVVARNNLKLGLSMIDTTSTTGKSPEVKGLVK